MSSSPAELDPAAVPPRPLGRPRAVPSRSHGNPREEILNASAVLFATHGYTTTTTRSIAETVGLRQASLFHYFSRKEDILAELLDRTVRPTLEFAHRIPAADLGPVATLWILVHNDAQLLCRGPYNRGSLVLLPEARGSQFASFWRLRYRLFGFYRRQVLDGIGSGVFPDAVAALAPDMVFSFVESLIIARPSVRSHQQSPPTMADAALRMLGASPERIATARYPLRAQGEWQ